MLCCMAAWLTGVLLAAVPCTQVYTTWLIEGTRPSATTTTQPAHTTPTPAHPYALKHPNLLLQLLTRTTSPRLFRWTRTKQATRRAA